MRRFLLMFAPLTSMVAWPPLTGASEAVVGHAERVCPSCEARLKAVLAHPRRDEDRSQDQWRHPAEVLAFYGIRPEMTVAEWMPNLGWYAKILIPYLEEKGHYVGLNPDFGPLDAKTRDLLGRFTETFKTNAEKWTGVPADHIDAYHSNELPVALNGTVDRVVITNELHNILRWPDGLKRELGRMHALLKTDGLLGLIEYRAKRDAPDSYVDGSKGYLREADVIRIVEAHGFELVASSEINANSKDSADWPGGVWTLPPSLWLKDQDRQKYLAIGEADRMTLLFRKRP